MSSKPKRQYNPYKRYCCVYGCLNRTNSQSELSFFKIPHDIETQREWIKVINREDLLDENKLKKVKYNYVCSVHFDDSAIITTMTTIKRLKCNTVPTKLLPHKSHRNIQPDAPDLIITTRKTSTQALSQTSKDISSRIQKPTKKDKVLVSTYSHTKSQTDTEEQKEIEPEITQLNISKSFNELNPKSTVLSEPTTSTSQSHAKTVRQSNSRTEGQDYGEPSSSFVDEDISNCSSTGPLNKNSEDVLEEQDHLTHTDYHCHECVGDIVGFRYLCVQCADFDMCAACEARGAHAHHYMLRVPADSPHHEATAILERIRQIVNIERQENHEVLIETESFKTDIEIDPLEGATTAKVEPQEPGDLELTLYPDAHDTITSDAATVQQEAQGGEGNKRQQRRKRRAPSPDTRADTPPVTLADTHTHIAHNQLALLTETRSKTRTKTKTLSDQVSVPSSSKTMSEQTPPTYEMSMKTPPKINAPVIFHQAPGSLIPIIMYNIPKTEISDELQPDQVHTSPHQL